MPLALATICTVRRAPRACRCCTAYTRMQGLHGQPRAEVATPAASARSGERAHSLARFMQRIGAAVVYERPQMDTRRRR